MLLYISFKNYNTSAMLESWDRIEKRVRALIKINNNEE